MTKMPVSIRKHVVQISSYLSSKYSENPDNHNLAKKKKDAHNNISKVLQKHKLWIAKESMLDRVEMGLWYT